MPRIERLPMWVRLVLYVLLLALILTGAFCLVVGKPFSAAGFLVAVIIIGITTAAEQVWIRRRGPI